MLEFSSCVAIVSSMLSPFFSLSTSHPLSVTLLLFYSTLSLYFRSPSSLLLRNVNELQNWEFQLSSSSHPLHGGGFWWGGWGTLERSGTLLKLGFNKGIKESHHDPGSMDASPSLWKIPLLPEWYKRGRKEREDTLYPKVLLNSHYNPTITKLY